MGEPKEGEAAFGATLEIDQPGLVAMQLEAMLGEAFVQDVHHPPSILLAGEHQHCIVSEAD